MLRIKLPKRQAETTIPSALCGSRLRTLRDIAEGSLVIDADAVLYLIEAGYVRYDKRWFKPLWYALTPLGTQYLREINT